MKITFKDANELKAHALEMVRELEETGLTHAKALAKVNAYLTKSEFCSSEGHILKLTLEDDPDSTHDTDNDSKALVAAVTAGVKEAMKGVTLNTNGKAPGAAPDVTVTREDWEILFDKKGAKHKKSTYGFDSVAEQALAIFYETTNKHNDPRLGLIRKAHKAYGKILADDAANKATPTTYASELVGADGGYAVAPEYREEIRILVQDEYSLLSLTDLTPTNSNVVNLVADQNAPWDNTSGIITGWRAQGTTMSQSKPVIQNRQVQLNELYALVPATDELLADAAQLNTHLMQKAPQKMGWQIDEAIFRGTGAGQPLGILTSPALVVAASTSGASTWTPLDVSKMIPRILKGMTRTINAAWFMTPLAYAYILNLSINSTTGFPVGLKQMTLEGGMIPTLLGMPVYETQHCAAFSSQGDIILADLKQGYASFQKAEGMDFASSIHLFFDAGATAFRWRHRIGGEPYLKTAVTPPQDTAFTQSHFVALAGR